MNKYIKFILIIAGGLLLAFGIYKLIVPETVVSIGSFEIKAKDNKDSYIAIGLGLIALLIGFIGRKKA